MVRASFEGANPDEQESSVERREALLHPPPRLLDGQGHQGRGGAGKEVRDLELNVFVNHFLGRSLSKHLGFVRLNSSFIPPQVYRYDEDKDDDEIFDLDYRDEASHSE